jgi:triacylglycerol esterase/lipase EstA (alpha/beta hydrolase family)
MPPHALLGSTVVLLHGLGRGPASMRPIERALRREGVDVLNLSYPSRRAPIVRHAELAARAIEKRAPGGRVHVVTHSMGGIVLRVAVANGRLPLERVGRVVMLAPPNRGSALMDRLRSHPVLGGVYRRMTGPAGADIAVSAEMTATLQPVPFELGVIAGDRYVNPYLTRLIEQPNDGKVSVAETMVDGMRDHIVVPHSHTFLMRAPRVIAQVIHFLECGRFKR